MYVLTRTLQYRPLYDWITDLKEPFIRERFLKNQLHVKPTLYTSLMSPDTTNPNRCSLELVACEDIPVHVRLSVRYLRSATSSMREESTGDTCLFQGMMKDDTKRYVLT